MHPARRIALFLISPLLPLLLFMTALDFGIVQTVGSPGDVKKLINDSGLYNGVVPGLLDQTKSVSTSIGNISTDDPVIKQAANQSLSPQDVQKNAESAIDSIYAWLNGKTDQPAFKIDLSASQKAFADNLANAVQTKAASLPACTTPYTSTSFDIGTATCLPAGVSPQALADQVRSQAGSEQNFITKPVISASDLKSGNDQQSVFQNQWKNLPPQYQKVKKTPYILLLLTVLVAIGIIFLSPTWRRGLRHVGWTLTIMGLFLLLLAWALDRSNSSLLQPQITISNPVIQADIRKLITDIVERVDHFYWLFGGFYAAAGILALSVPLLMLRRQASPEPAPSEPETTGPLKTVKKPDAKS